MMQKFLSKSGRYAYTRRSRWIKIRFEAVTKRHSLYEYADHYDNDCLVYFIKDGRKYALGQFLRFNAFGNVDNDHMFSDREGLHILAGYDCTDYYKPYVMELSDDSEYVRLYTQEVVE